jgi:hypothetical protein
VCHQAVSGAPGPYNSKLASLGFLLRRSAIIHVDCPVQQRTVRCNNGATAPQHNARLQRTPANATVHEPCAQKLEDYGEATLAQNKIFNPIKPRTTAVIGHGITTRRAEQRKTSRCKRTRRAVSCSRRCPSRPRTVRPSAPDAAPPRYPHVQGGSAAYRTARFAMAAWRGREVSDGCSFAGGKFG